MIQDTSSLAYFSEVKGSLGRRHQAVMFAFTKRDAFTNQELADFLEWPINTVTPRVKELRDKNMLVNAGTRKCKSTGRTAMVWKLNNGKLF